MLRLHQNPQPSSFLSHFSPLSTVAKPRTPLQTSFLFALNRRLIFGSGTARQSAPMKKLYRKSTVHPTPSAASNNLSSYLPAAILTLIAALSPADREVLAYFTSTIFSDSDSRTGQKFASGGGDHPLCSKCSCFRCYKTYWAKWDSSPNRQLIDEIMDAYEVSLSKHSPMKDSLLKDGKKEKNRRDRRKGKSSKGNISLELDESVKSIKSELSLAVEDSHFVESSPAADGGAETGGGDEEDYSLVEEDCEKGSVRRFVSFLGERIWGVWG